MIKLKVPLCILVTSSKKSTFTTSSFAVFCRFQQHITYFVVLDVVCQRRGAGDCCGGDCLTLLAALFGHIGQTKGRDQDATQRSERRSDAQPAQNTIEHNSVYGHNASDVSQHSHSSQNLGFLGVKLRLRDQTLFEHGSQLFDSGNRVVVSVSRHLRSPRGHRE